MQNGSEIWDFAGNVWESVDWTKETPNTTFDVGPSTCPENWQEIQNQINACSGFTPNLGPFGQPSDLVSPLDPALNSTNHTGRLFGGPHGGRAHRGGNWNNGIVNSGIFSLSLNWSAAGRDTNNGFRCVFRD